MPFQQMKVQPLDCKGTARIDLPVGKPPAAKSRLKRLLERQFPGVLRISSSEKLAGDAGGGGAAETEPSSVCLDKMVLSFIEESNNSEKPSARCSRNRCNCFNGNNCDDSSDDEFAAVFDHQAPIASPPPGDASEIIKGLVPCACLVERNLLADASKIVETSKSKGKDECRRIVTADLRSLGYDASICKSRWEKTPSYPAGEYEYIDVIVGGDRLILDVDFRSEFEIARSTKSYRAVLQSVPSIFVGKADRLQQIVAVVSEAARQSLKKKGLHFPPWRKTEYMKAKWLAPHERTSTDAVKKEEADAVKEDGKREEESFSSESCPLSAVSFNGEVEAETVVASPWQPPPVRPKPVQAGAKIVAGLASVLTEKPQSPSPSPSPEF